jgi:putative restriction endonuclease
MTWGPTAATLTLLEKLAVDNGFDRELAREGVWLAFASTQCPLRIWLSTAGEELFLTALSQGNVAMALDTGIDAPSPLPADAVAVRAVTSVGG